MINREEETYVNAAAGVNKRQGLYVVSNVSLD